WCSLKIQACSHLVGAGLSAASNRSANVAGLLFRAAAIEDDIWNPATTTARKTAPRIRARISRSLVGGNNRIFRNRAALFQERFAASGKEFRSRHGVRHWANVSAL